MALANLGLQSYLKMLLTDNYIRASLPLSFWPSDQELWACLELFSVRNETPLRMADLE